MCKTSAAWCVAFSKGKRWRNVFHVLFLAGHLSLLLNTVRLSNVHHLFSLSDLCCKYIRSILTWILFIRFIIIEFIFILFNGFKKWELLCNIDTEWLALSAHFTLLTSTTTQESHKKKRSWNTHVDWYIITRMVALVYSCVNYVILRLLSLIIYEWSARGTWVASLNSVISVPSKKTCEFHINFE